MESVERDGVVFEVVTEIAAREGVSPTELPPLARTIDPDALSTLVDSRPDRAVTVEFSYCGYDVTVESGDSISVRQATSALRE